MRKLVKLWVAMMFVALFAACPPPANGDAGNDADAPLSDASLADAALADIRTDTRIDDVASTDTTQADHLVADTHVDGAPADTTLLDHTATDTNRNDVACPDVTGTDACPFCNVGVDAGAAEDEHGFWIRVPQQRDVCVDNFDGWSTTPEWDVDYVCTLNYQNYDAVIYVQFRPTACRFFGACTTVTDGAWIFINNAVTSTSATYDWGGNHRNDAIEVQYDGKKFNFSHSSIGFGARACQRPDCIQVFAANDTLIEDGCTVERSLPAVCVRVENDGSVAELIDTFAPCPGDPNYQ